AIETIYHTDNIISFGKDFTSLNKFYDEQSVSNILVNLKLLLLKAEKNHTKFEKIIAKISPIKKSIQNLKKELKDYDLNKVKDIDIDSKICNKLKKAESNKLLYRSLATIIVVDYIYFFLNGPIDISMTIAIGAIELEALAVVITVVLSIMSVVAGNVGLKAEHTKAEALPILEII
ncbi:2785_t:CDS:1, partial [Funneliformis caledonium]